MALTFTGLMIAAVLVGFGCAVTYVILQRTLRRTMSDLQLTMQQQLNVLTGTLKVLEARVAELSSSPAVRAAVVPAAKTEVVPPVAREAVRPKIELEKQQQEEVTPEMLVVIAAAVTAFLGKKVRIRSAKMLQSPYEIVNPWSQQGRVFVQASHNLRSRG